MATTFHLRVWTRFLQPVEEVQRHVQQAPQNPAKLLYTDFHHETLFEPSPDGCRYVDSLTFTPALPLQKLTAILTRRIFMHRHRLLAKNLASDPQATAIGVLRVKVESNA